MKTLNIIRILAFIALLFFGSCSAGYHIKKAIKKDPTILVADTITYHDTVRIITENVSTDSVFMLSSDTIILQKDKLTIKHYYHKDSVYLWGECESDTIWKVREIKVPYERVIYNEEKRLVPGWVWILAIILAGLYYLNKKRT